MNSRTLHRTLGLVLLAPLLLWGLTGVFFLFKPGYEGAYQKLSPKLYALDTPLSLQNATNWHEARVLKTVLGYHLLVNRNGEWTQLNPETLLALEAPSIGDLKALVADAITADPERYGSIESVENGVFVTSTGVEINLDWSTLTLRQKGRDTFFISTLYQIHYLQWLGDPVLNKVLGALGIILLLSLTFLGLRIYLKNAA